MPKFIVRYKRAFINHPETMLLEVNFDTPEIKAALLTLVQRKHPTAKQIEEITLYKEPVRNPRRAVYRLPSNLL
jgi:hypothetical protein